MTALLHDVKYGIRMLFKHPGLAGISVLALGLGLGLTTTMWSINYGALMRGLPFPDADRIMAVQRTIPERHINRTGMNILDYDILRREQTSFVDLAGYNQGTVNLSGGEGRPERYQGGFVTANAFPLLGVRPLLGRFFTAEEEATGGPTAVILGYDLWRNRFHASRDIIGTPVRVNGTTATIVGVMPEGFKFPILEDLWVPLRADRLKESRNRGTFVAAFGKLKPGVSVDQAMQQFTTIEDRLAREYPQTNKGVKPLIEGYTNVAIGPEPRLMLWTMMGATLAVLLIACSNVANLLLARAAVRTKEVAVRTALGASRWRIVSQLLAESLVLSAAGSLLGIAIALYGVKWFNDALVSARPPFWIDISVDPAILAFVGGLTLLAALLSGVLPALQATGTHVFEVLKDESRGTSSMRLGVFSKGLVVLEIALSCGLLIGAGFMIQSVVTRSHFKYGVTTNDKFTARVGLFETTYPDSASRQRFWNSVTERLEAQPGQRGVAVMTALPGVGSGTSNFAIEGTTYATERDYPEARTPVVSAGFFRTFELTPVEGRVFTSGDIGGAEPVAVVTRDFAAKYFAGQSALGRRIRIGGKDSSLPWRTIVGVIPDVWYQGTDDETPEAILTPIAQGDFRFLTVVVRSAGADPMSFADVVRREVAGVDPDQPIYFADTLHNRIAQNGWFYNVFGTLFAVFGVAALFLATIGVYGVMSFAVTRRTAEVGVRMALGAGRHHVLRMFLRQGAWQIGSGAVLGLGLAVLLSRGLKVVLFQVNINDVRMFAAVTVAMALTGLVATLIPARRATRVDPVIALRYE